MCAWEAPWPGGDAGPSQLHSQRAQKVSLRHRCLQGPRWLTFITLAHLRCWNILVFSTSCTGPELADVWYHLPVDLDSSWALPGYRDQSIDGPRLSGGDYLPTDREGTARLGKREPAHQGDALVCFVIAYNPSLTYAGLVHGQGSRGVVGREVTSGFDGLPSDRGTRAAKLPTYLKHIFSHLW